MSKQKPAYILSNLSLHSLITFVGKGIYTVQPVESILYRVSRMNTTLSLLKNLLEDFVGV